VLTPQGGMAAVPSLPTQGIATGNDNAPPTPHIKSGRRLSKSVMRADSQDAEGSKGWGMVELPDGAGTARVVQKAESEDFNMYKVTWVWSIANKTWQIDLRHGRKSGIKKIYVNKEERVRQKSMKDLLVSSGSEHIVQLDDAHEAVIKIVPKSAALGGSGFTYQLTIDGSPVEQNLAGPMSKGNLDIGERCIQLPKSDEGLGMTLRNNPLGQIGCVVWAVEPNKAAAREGLRVGDVVLSVEADLVNSIEPLMDIVAKCRTVVNMELAGASASREILLFKNKSGSAVPGPIGLGLQTTSCGIGVLVSEIDGGSASADSELKLGDCILSIDDKVPSSPHEAVHYIRKGDDPVKFVVIGDAVDSLPAFHASGGVERSN